MLKMTNKMAGPSQAELEETLRKVRDLQAKRVKLRTYAMTREMYELLSSDEKSLIGFHRLRVVDVPGCVCMDITDVVEPPESLSLTTESYNPIPIPLAFRLFS